MTFRLQETFAERSRSETLADLGFDSPVPVSGAERLSQQ